MTRAGRRGQSTAEYAIVISVVIAAVIGMQLYMKRGLQAKARAVTDRYTRVSTSNGVALNGTALSQYEPYYAESDVNVTQTSNATDTYAQGGAFSRSAMDEQTTRRGSQSQGVNVNATNQWR